MSMQTPREIAFEDIRKGDEIEGRWDHAGASMTVRGVVHTLREGAWVAEGGGLVANGYWPRWRYYLHARPAPAEPTGLGAVVRARTRSGSREGQFVHIRAELGTERWQGPGGGIYYWSDFDPDTIEVLSEGIEVES